jgi:hypothetical protein
MNYRRMVRFIGLAVPPALIAGATVVLAASVPSPSSHKGGTQQTQSSQSNDTERHTEVSVPPEADVHVNGKKVPPDSQMTVQTGSTSVTVDRNDSDKAEQGDGSTGGSSSGNNVTVDVDSSNSGGQRQSSHTSVQYNSHSSSNVRSTGSVNIHQTGEGSVTTN